MSKKLGVIVPYRDRYHHLVTFKKHIKSFLNDKGIDYELIVVEQDDAKNFNRGKLLNIGFIYAKKLKCDYVVFHDVDMIPVDVDYSYSDCPIHLATNFIVTDINFNRIVFDEYFGGVTLFSIDDFELINGYSNEYWGWGYEDDDLLYRCKINGITLNEKEILTSGPNGAALEFNGMNSYVEGKNTFDLKNPISFFISFCSDDIFCEYEKYDDTYTIFSIPGLDLNINYNSYSRYNFEMYDINEKVIYVNSKLKPNYKTTICVTINPLKKVVKMYQDGEIVGEKEYEDTLYEYENVNKFYLGVGNPEREETPKYFKGLVNSFAVFDKELKEREILTISKNQSFGLTQNFKGYNSSNNLTLYYDSKIIKDNKLIDLSGNENHGKILSCKTVEFNFDKIKLLHIPYRRNCSFKLLKHEENGFVNGSWKEQTTRFNQMKYYNEVLRGTIKTKEDGLNNCKYKEIGHAKVENETHITVSI